MRPDVDITYNMYVTIRKCQLQNGRRTHKLYFFFSLKSQQWRAAIFIAIAFVIALSLGAEKKEMLENECLTFLGFFFWRFSLEIVLFSHCEHSAMSFQRDSD